VRGLRPYAEGPYVADAMIDASAPYRYATKFAIKPMELSAALGDTTGNIMTRTLRRSTTMADSTTRVQPGETRQLEPNQFTLEGYDTQITYSASSFSGVPQFSFSDRVETRSFSGAEIRQEDTGVGRMVTVQLQNNAADQGFEHVTLFLPTVQLSAEEQSITIHTLAIRTREVVFVAPGARQLQTYAPISLSGTAARVDF